MKYPMETALAEEFDFALKKWMGMMMMMGGHELSVLFRPQAASRLGTGFGWRNRTNQQLRRSPSPEGHPDGNTEINEKIPNAPQPTTQPFFSLLAQHSSSLISNELCPFSP